MPLTPQEQRCVEHACAFLAGSRGGEWRIADGQSLDDQHQNVPSPEVIVTDGTTTAAVEVKRITGDSTWDSYVQSWLSLRSYLVPRVGGSYSLNPFEDFRYPMSREMMRIVKREIERVAPGMSVGERRTIRIPRQAVVSLIHADGDGYIYCTHNVTGHHVKLLSSRISGAFFLVDSDQWEHEFVTDEAKEDFAQAVIQACQLRLQDGNATALWYEEWGITRLEDDDSPDEVTMLVVTEARDMHGAGRDAVGTRVAAAQPKFANIRWADIHVLVLENLSGVVLSARHLAEGAATLDAADFEDIDLVLLVDGDQVQQIRVVGP